MDLLIEWQSVCELREHVLRYTFEKEGCKLRYFRKDTMHLSADSRVSKLHSISRYPCMCVYVRHVQNEPIPAAERSHGQRSLRID